MSDMMKLVKELGAANAIKTVEISALRAENERLREALRPFAVGQKVIHRWYSSDIFPDVPDDHPVLSNKITVGDLRRARAALEGVTEPASPWRDIESAPKDGTKFLAWFTWPGRHSVEMARWQSNQFAKQPKPYWTCDNERLHGIIATRAAQPTHWMPLPERPANTQTGER